MASGTSGTVLAATLPWKKSRLTVLEARPEAPKKGMAHMILFLKKLGVGAIYFTILNVVFFYGSALSKTLFNNAILENIFTIFVSSTVIIIIIFRRRYSSFPLRKEYLDFLQEDEISLKKELFFSKKNLNLKMDILAFGTVLFAFNLFFLSTKNYSLLIKIFGTIFLFIGIVSIFALIDFMIWVFIHNKWRKDKIFNYSKQ